MALFCTLKFVTENIFCCGGLKRERERERESFLIKNNSNNNNTK